MTPPFPCTQPMRDEFREELGQESNNRNSDKLCSEEFLSTYGCWKNFWGQNSNAYADAIAAYQAKQRGVKIEEKWDISRLAIDRGDSCFFYPYRHQLELKTTQEIVDRDEARREAKKGRRLAKWAIGIAAGSLILSVLVGWEKLAGICEKVWQQLK